MKTAPNVFTQTHTQQRKSNDAKISDGNATGLRANFSNRRWGLFYFVVIAVHAGFRDARGKFTEECVCGELASRPFSKTWFWTNSSQRPRWSCNGREKTMNWTEKIRKNVTIQKSQPQIGEFSVKKSTKQRKDKNPFATPYCRISSVAVGDTATRLSPNEGTVRPTTRNRRQIATNLFWPITLDRPAKSETRRVAAKLG